MDRPPSEEIAQLRKRIDRQAHSLAVMAAAISALRDGSQALRDENRALRLKLKATQRSGAGTDQSNPRACASRHEPGKPRRSEGEYRA